MKAKLITFILTLTASLAFGHGDIELGPNKGRILEFSNDETMHGEVSERDGKLHVALLDKDMKPVKVLDQTLTATAGTRQAPVKCEVTKTESGFMISPTQPGEWVIIQYKESGSSKVVTARLHYDTKSCAPCGNPEWRCACEDKKKEAP
jgi:hypothetical protein